MPLRQQACIGFPVRRDACVVDSAGAFARGACMYSELLDRAKGSTFSSLALFRHGWQAVEGVCRTYSINIYSFLTLGTQESEQ